MLQMGVPPVQLHVMSSISGVEWDEVWSDRVEGPLGGHRVPFVGRDTFLRNKRAAGRPKDLADVDALEPGRDGPQHLGEKGIDGGEQDALLKPRGSKGEEK